LSPSANLASIINRIAFSRRCDIDRTPHETGVAQKSRFAVSASLPAFARSRHRCCPMHLRCRGFLVRRDAAERESPVENRDLDLRHAMRHFVSPAHLPLLGQ
ncbi:hypothetical protein, partial [Caballeronia sordidicola]|uniref:hypothetical protein n=1 Tax=Caballeronia sordidicola TaxID=196367 RepID=UPI001C52A6A9